MRCPRCGAENRQGSNFCRYCSFNFTAQDAKPNSGYIPSVPPPDATSFKQYYEPQAGEAWPAQPPQQYRPPPAPAKYVHGQTPCPRCNSMSVSKGSTPVWAILLAVILAPFTCFLSLFFLMVRDPNRCLSCGVEFR